jgi:hypothetical protein
VARRFRVAQGQRDVVEVLHGVLSRLGEVGVREFLVAHLRQRGLLGVPEQGVGGSRVCMA